MNFGSITAEIGNFTPNNASTQRDAMLANFAYHDVLSARKWSCLETTGSITLVAGTRGYVLLGTSPALTDCDGVFDVTLVLTAGASGVRIPYCNPQMFNDCFAHVFTNSQPSMWTVLGGAAATTPAAVISGGQQQLTLNYPPVVVAGSGVSLTCRYWRSASSIEMVASTDVPILPANMHDLVVQRGIVRAMESQHLYADAAQQQSRYEEMLAKFDVSDSAQRFSDFQQIEYRTLPQLDNRVAHTPNTYNTAALPYPQAQS
jgi:hypothetical protein